MDRIFDLADQVLEIMIKEPGKGYKSSDLMSVINCSPSEITNVFAILKAKKFINQSINVKTNKPGDEFTLSDTGGDFFLSGGYREQKRVEKLMSDNIEASIKSLKHSKFVSTIAIIVSVCTFLIVLFQFLQSLCCCK